MIKLKTKTKNYMYMIIYYNTKSDAVCYPTDSDRYVQYALAMWQPSKNMLLFLLNLLIAINSPVLNDDRRPRYMVLIQAITF